MTGAGPAKRWLSSRLYPVFDDYAVNYGRPRQVPCALFEELGLQSITLAQWSAILRLCPRHTCFTPPRRGRHFEPSTIELERAEVCMQAGWL